MPDEDPKLDMNRYHYRPGTTEPELRPEFAEEEARKAEAEAAAAADEGPVGRPSGKKPRAARQTKAAKTPASKKK